MRELQEDCRKARQNQVPLLRVYSVGRTAMEALRVFVKVRPETIKRVRAI